jgi:hypothetical protein
VAGFDTHQTPLEIGKEAEDFTSPQLTMDDRSAGFVRPMNLENALGYIETNDCNLHELLLCLAPSFEVNDRAGVHPISLLMRFC